ncbi:MAG: PCMD domain-containing protein [Bacteroidales bacterium]|nr:PCMD domain-containing protein [Candidatus Cryptobacteroides onthequi]
MKRLLAVFLSAVCISSCIKNDLPYPLVVPSISSLTATGAKGCSIDSDARTVVIDLEETTDIAAVEITSVTLSEGAVADPQIIGRHDMRSPFHVTISTFQDYQWTFSATQSIERYFSVEGQVGASEIDAENCRAIAHVRSTTDLENIKVRSLKLGPEGITQYSTPFSQMHDFSDCIQVDVTAHSRTQTWRLFVEQTETLVELTSVSPWTRVAWLSATGLSDADNGFRYRQVGSDEWKDVRNVVSDGGSFSAMLEPLLPQTTYECMAFSGDNETDAVTFTTDPEAQLPNSGFETYSQPESKNYYSFFDPASTAQEMMTKWWDSGNAGSTTVGASYSICTPDTEDFKEGKASVRMNSRNVVIKFAAGNMFSGEFAGVIGTQGGKVNFGRPFTLRPRSLRLWLKYKSGSIDCIGTYPDSDPVKMGDSDRGTVYVALGDWDYHRYGGTPQSPVQVNTTDKSTLFKPDAEAVIAYGSWNATSSTDGWVQVEIPLVYNSVTRRPTHIIVSCAASALGDYFTGSSQSVLWVDDMQLVY